jgi:DNA-binding response OmpR family regulator
LRSPAEEPAEQVRRRILIVEDNKADVFLICEAINAANLNADVQVVSDGEKALGVFEEADRDNARVPPTLVILDINLPKKNGSQVLRQMRASRRCANAIVLVVTSSDSARDRDLMANLGVNGYFRKPSEYDDFMKLSQIVKVLLDEKGESSALQ